MHGMTISFCARCQMEVETCRGLRRYVITLMWLYYGPPSGLFIPWCLMAIIATRCPMRLQSLPCKLERTRSVEDSLEVLGIPLA